MDYDPIKQLQSFLDERGKVLEKISNIHSALGSIHDDIPPPTQASQTAPLPLAETNQRREDIQYSRLTQTLHEMQAQIEERVRPAIQLVMQAQVDRLRDQSDQQQAALRDCLEQIDQSILTCLARMDEYRQGYADLATLNKHLADLGTQSESLYTPVSVDSTSDVINARLADLQAKGKV